MCPPSVLAFALFVCMLPLGTNSLKCYHCSEFTGTDQISCRAPKEKECTEDEDRCIKIHLKTNGTGMVDKETAVNCSTSAKCNGFCNDYKKNHANILECSHECCEGDLCNHPQNSTTAVVVGPASSTETPATGTSSGTGVTTTPGEPRSAEPSSLIQNVKAPVLLLALMGLILVF